jgi:hypothetical protein
LPQARDPDENIFTVRVNLDVTLTPEESNPVQKLSLEIDGFQIATFKVDSAHPTQLLRLRIHLAGLHRYTLIQQTEIDMQIHDNSPPGMLTVTDRGEGTVDIYPGDRLVISKTGIGLELRNESRP